MLFYAVCVLYCNKLLSRLWFCGTKFRYFVNIGDAKDAFRLIREFDARNPLLIVDPPRKGLTRELITDIAEHGIRSVLYISCGPDTFARDLAIFRSFGYDISPVQPVDLFPRTSHVENIAFLSRKEKRTMSPPEEEHQGVPDGKKSCGTPKKIQ